MNDVAGSVHWPVVVGHLVAVEVDTGQVGGGDLVICQPERVDQERIGPRDAERDVVVDDACPSIEMRQPIGGGQIDAGMPFGITHAKCHILAEPMLEYMPSLK